MTKFVFITGGVVSSLGKGITAASLGRLLKARGFTVAINKLDPYLNVDPGTMNPYQHGEVFVTDDGAETDLDIGHYERFIDESLSRDMNTTSGQIYTSVLDKERKGIYQGNTVQVIPNVTGEIKQHILNIVEKQAPDILITEVGGTVGDIECQPFLEALRQLKWQKEEEDSCFIHVTLVPYLKAAGELKSKPTQHSVKELLGMGIQPNVLVCRSEIEIDQKMRDKIAKFCNVPTKNVIQNLNAKSLYEVPIMMEDEGLADAVLDTLGLQNDQPDLTEWRAQLNRLYNPKSEVTIALVGKYIELHDAYLSIVEALTHAGAQTETKVNISWISSQSVNNENAAEILGAVDGIIVPGGFGDRGIEGKIAAARFARENGTPYLGICLGMHMACIEFARNVLNHEKAHSTECNPSSDYPIITLMNDQLGVQLGGTLRLGLYSCLLAPDSIVRRLYDQELVYERHRHRYEFNNDFMDEMQKGGMRVTGWNDERHLVEIVEIPEHPWFIGVQFHPEFKSRFTRPHPIFVGLVNAANENREKRFEKVAEELEETTVSPIQLVSIIKDDEAEE